MPILLAKTTMLSIFIHPLHSLPIMLRRVVGIAVMIIPSIYNIWLKVEDTITDHSDLCSYPLIGRSSVTSIMTNNLRIKPDLSLYYNPRRMMIRSSAVLINVKWSFRNRWPRLPNAKTYFLAKMIVNSVYSLALA